MLATLAGATACDRIISNLGGGAVGPEAGVLRGKLPMAERGVTQVKRFTDGIAAKPGDPARTDLTSALTSADAFVTWDLGAVVPVRCALIDADGDDRYQISLSYDLVTFTPLWTAEPDEDRGQQLRAGRGLTGSGRYLRLSAAGGDGKWTVSELSAWADCPTSWPPLAMQAGTPDEDAVRIKLWAFAGLAVAYVLLYRKRLPDWAKLLGVAPAGLGLALVFQLLELRPLSEAIAGRLVAALGAVVLAIVVKVALARRENAPPPSA
jgi:hypothetical protein